MSSPRPNSWAAILLLPLLLVFAFPVLGADEDDEYVPDVTARVVRISLLSGDVQVRRGAEEQTWERATLNLPLVEGDELVTGPSARVEVQFDRDSYVRLDENSTLKFTTVRDEGIALSVPQGTISLRVLSFKKSKEFFEIDAPSTTVSVEKPGMYRIDSGDVQSPEIRVTVTEGGQARIYSDNSGFTLNNGRSAKLFLSGNLAGEWETSDAARYADSFDRWVMDRESVVAKLLKNSYYDRYYDRDIYGAEDLNGYGDWIYTRDYGYVWRPYRNSLSSYSNWSPYRYGHWRWVPFYGWTWVNDEPWGWATYHYGRWVWYNNYWIWSPYASYRWRRSWWRPAMVSIVTWNGSVCWYPLSYYDRYYDYNRRFRRGNRNPRNNNPPVNPNPIPPVNPNPSPNNDARITRSQTPPFQRIPPGAVVSVDERDFGRGLSKYKTPPLETSRSILTRKIEENQSPPILPDYKSLDGKVSREIRIEQPRLPKVDTVKTGATERKPGVSMDEDLKKERILGNRNPVNTKREPNESPGIIVNPNSDTRKTGAVNRPTTKQDDGNTRQNNPTVNQGPVRDTGAVKRDNRDSEKTKRIPSQETRTPPIYTPQPRTDTKEQPKQDERRTQPMPRPKETPTPPVYTPQPRREEPRQQPVPRVEPRQQPTPRVEPRQQPQPRQPESKPQPKQSESKSKQPESKPDNRRTNPKDN